MTDPNGMDWSDWTYEELSYRQSVIQERLPAVTVEPLNKKTNKKPTNDESALMTVEKTDTHWDFLLKEMQWLAADFTAERKRHKAARRKVAHAVAQDLANREQRRIRQRQAAHQKQRKTASRHATRVQQWWTQLERVIAYQQKVKADQQRQKEMNQQLVKLVQLTERYTQQLGNHCTADVVMEQALQMGSRRSKQRVKDYAQLRMQPDFLYGESTDDSGSDATYTLETDSSDDETTLLQAEAEEARERQLGDDPFVPDPEELQKLRQEMDMPIEQVLQRFQQEADRKPMETNSSSSSANEEDRTSKKVHFAAEPDIQEIPLRSTSPTTRLDPGEDADDDRDVSDVEDYNEDDDQDDFEMTEEPVDDETTMMEEEKLPREMTVEEELELLQNESQLPVEELRRRYAEVFASQQEEDESTVKEDMEEVVGDEDGEFVPEGEAVDDETTLIAEEKMGRDMSYEDEIALLHNESEIPIEQLKQMYQSMQAESETEEDDCADNDDDASSDDETTEKAFHALVGPVRDSNIQDDEYQPDASEGIDDETTIEAEEKMGRDMSYEDEIALLRNESEIPIEQLKQMYQSMQAESETEEDDCADNDDDASSDDETTEKTFHALVGPVRDSNIQDDEYQPDASEGIDDETTIEAEEKMGREMTYEEELDILKRESEMSIEELRAMYADMEGGSSAEGESEEEEEVIEDESLDSDGEFEPDAMEVDDETTIEAEERLGREMTVEEEIARLNDENNMSLEGLKAMYGISQSEPSQSLGEKRSISSSQDSKKKARLDVMESSTEEATITSKSGQADITSVSRPFLLSPSVKLREYQQAGLGWLVSLQARMLNGILADEMGLGKTLQTISLLAYLASYKGIWGPHLIVVPTSVILNWETELKRFAPGLKVLCYYGTAKRRKELRTGWTKSNWYHVVITSYQLAVQDAFAFKRKRWYYLVLDEAQNIKNFQSQRWQTLITFNTQRRLLLSGTPLQNNLMELWSLLHFLMPHIFRSRKEFSFWFANPMNSLIEGKSNQNDDMVNRLHGIIRPFVLRRLKKDVETQMPGKFEHIVKCQLSRRQMFIYEEFMARSSTRQALKKGGNYMGMMNVLMQLRKVCNHPDLFEPRSVITPFVLDPISFHVPVLALNALGACDVYENVTASLLKPLWCGSCGQPSLEAATLHDRIESDEFMRLEEDFEATFENCDQYSADSPACLLQLVKKIREAKFAEKTQNTSFLNHINKRRCSSFEFAYSDRLVRLVKKSEEPLKLWQLDEISSPSHLLALRRTQEEKADDLDVLIRKFVFCVPKAGGQPVNMICMAHDAQSSKEAKDDLVRALEKELSPFQRAHNRLTSFFPDKKLVQFDSGKLQTLAELLRELKRGGHRVLIFTQMSKMLDILEAFLNLNGHSYLRLDGSTGVDRRQRLMDRFNNDEKVFCFILSTRSGGMGINLTGADTVIFYDNDWNPAMDAQAQDRAHRIGQTREVHIFRLITEHTIEENILLKAKQKKNLDRLVMDEGYFDASSLSNRDEKARGNDPETNDGLYSKGGLREILGIELETGEAVDDNNDKDGIESRTKEQMESAMASLEDADDLEALRGAQKEAADELKEFDESIEYKNDSDPDDDQANKHSDKDKGEKAPSERKEERKIDEADLEKEFAAWQSQVGMDPSSVEASLSPMERYGLHFRTDVDPFYSVYAIMEQQRLEAASHEQVEEVDVDNIEREKMLEEQRAMEDGDLLATFPQPDDLVRQRSMFLRERARLRSNKKLRKLTGQDWESRSDALTQTPFWYNVDSGEATWDKPKALIELEAFNRAAIEKWDALPRDPLVHIMSYLSPYPDRQNASLMSRHWKKAASDLSFIRHVYPVEMGAYTRDDNKIERNHYRNLADAVAASLPGDTIELGDGHYWTNEDLEIRHPVRLIGDEHNPANVIIEMSGTLVWKAKGGFCEGITFRRPKLGSSDSTKKALLRLESGSRIDMLESVLDNDGGNDHVVVGKNCTGVWKNVILRNGVAGLVLDDSGYLNLKGCYIHNSQKGIVCTCSGKVNLEECRIANIDAACVDLRTGANAVIRQCNFVSDRGANCMIIERDEEGSASFFGNHSEGFSKERIPW